MMSPVMIVVLQNSLLVSSSLLGACVLLFWGRSQPKVNKAKREGEIVCLRCVCMGGRSTQIRIIVYKDACRIVYRMRMIVSDDGCSIAYNEACIIVYKAMVTRMRVLLFTRMCVLLLCVVVDKNACIIVYKAACIFVCAQGRMC